MRRILSSSLSSPSPSSSVIAIAALLSIATQYCRYALGQPEDISSDENLFALEDQKDLFSNTLDPLASSSSSSTDIATSGEEEPNSFWAAASSSPSLLQPIDDAYLSADNNNDNNNAVFSSPPADIALLSADYLSSPSFSCLTEDPSFSSDGSLFGRSDDSAVAVQEGEGNNIAAASDFCFQIPDTEGVTPPLTFPNLFDLLQPDNDPNDLLAPPLLTFPKRPFCPGRDPMYLLCCEKGHRFTWDCEKCMYNAVFSFSFPPPNSLLFILSFWF